jgi:cell wall-associated NlpC family hydrolase
VRFARVPHHVGVMIGERQFVHALFKHHVVVANLDEYRARLEAVYRPIARVDGRNFAACKRLICLEPPKCRRSISSRRR